MCITYRSLNSENLSIMNPSMNQFEQSKKDPMVVVGAFYSLPLKEITLYIRALVTVIARILSNIHTPNFIPSLKLTQPMKIPLFPGKYHQNGGFSWAMLVAGRVTPRISWLFTVSSHLHRCFWRKKSRPRLCDDGAMVLSIASLKGEKNRAVKKGLLVV